MFKETDTHCISLDLIIEDKISPTYKIVIADTFDCMKGNKHTTFLENATIQSKDGWFIVEGDALVREKVKWYTRYTLKELERFRDPNVSLVGISDPYSIIGYPVYKMRESWEFLDETVHQKFTFQHAIFQEFLDL